MTQSHANATAPDLSGRTVFAIDLLSRVYQLFHALPEMTAPDGTPVSVVFGLTRDLLDILEKRRPDYLLCATDAAGPTFRHAQYADYKAHRAEMPADLVSQIPLVRRLLEVLGIPCLELPGFEADDLLATLATRVAAAGGTCTIATADKDARQLLGDGVELYNLRTNAAFGPEELRAEWGIAPGQVVDFLSLVGDSVDNVPGVPGIGPKTATDLLQTYGTLDDLLARVDEIRQPKRRESLALHADTARAARELIRLDTAAPIAIPWEAAARHEPDAERLAELLREFGFRSLLSRVAGRGAGGGQGAAQPAKGDGPQVAPSSARPRRPALLFDVDAVDERPPAAAAPDWVVADSTDRASELVALLRGQGPLTLVTTRLAGSMPRSRPSGVALAAGAACGWVAADFAMGHPALAGLLEDATLPKRTHDSKRQALALRGLGIRLGGVVFDSLLAAYLLEAGERNLGLVETARRHGLDVDAFVPEGVEVGMVDWPAEPAAAAVHVRLAEALCDRLPPLLVEAGLSRLADEVELPLAGVLAEMEWRGVRIDAERLGALAADYAARLAALEREIHALAGREFSIASPIQLRTILFDTLGLPVVKRTKTGPSTDAEVLEELAPLHPLPAKLLEHRRYAKLKSTYVDALPLLVDPATGRVHTSLNQTVTATGRLSSSDPNLQNIPVRSAEGQQIRAAFLPGEPGWRFVAADYSQIELRMLAHLSGDERMRAAFTAGEDIHTRTAALVQGVEPSAVTPAMRRAAKAVNFGILYGQSAFGLAKALGIPQAEAAAFIAAYFASFSGAAAFIDDVLDRCRRDGQVTTILGRRRAIRGVRERSARRTSAGVLSLSLPERTAVNTVVQGSAADLIKLAMLRVAGRLVDAGLEAALVLQIHDELLLEAPADEVGAVTDLVVGAMRTALPLEVPLEVSVHVGGTWAECEK
jgi:DNA polymerase-1